MRIALDLDGVLADLHGAMAEHSDHFGHEDFTEWKKEPFDLFLDEARRVWDDKWWRIDPVEPNLDHKTALLDERWDVDVVTNTVGPRAEVRAWLENQDIVFDELVFADKEGVSKQELDYDVYIDDKPMMVGTVPLLYLRDRPWNQNERGLGEYFYHSYEPGYVVSEGLPPVYRFAPESPHVVRVTGLTDVLYDLQRIP